MTDLKPTESRIALAKGIAAGHVVDHGWIRGHVTWGNEYASTVVTGRVAEFRVAGLLEAPGANGEKPPYPVRFNAAGRVWLAEHTGMCVRCLETASTGSCCSSLRGPAPRPCDSCPYRRDVPAGVWAGSEYDKLPRYDEPTYAQPPQVFVCHQQNGRVCAGWAGCHDGANLLSLRVVLFDGVLSPADYGATVGYACPVPLFSSGAEAAEHGRSGIEWPDAPARRVIAKVYRRLAEHGGAS